MVQESRGLGRIPEDSNYRKEVPRILEYGKLRMGFANRTWEMLHRTRHEELKKENFEKVVSSDRCWMKFFFSLNIISVRRCFMIRICFYSTGT